MEWLEAVQKIVPWLGTLPIVHKLILSAVVAGTAGFFLLLIWIPVPTPKLLDGFVESSGAAAKASKQLAQDLESEADLPTVATAVEKQQLKGVIRDLGSLEAYQVPLPSLLREYAKRPDPRRWGEIADIMVGNSRRVSDLVETLEDFDGDLMVRDIDTYRQLRLVMGSRARLYHQLARMEPPATPAETATLLKIADNFEELISQTETIQRRLSAYLDD